MGDNMKLIREFNQRHRSDPLASSLEKTTRAVEAARRLVEMVKFTGLRTGAFVYYDKGQFVDAVMTKACEDLSDLKICLLSINNARSTIGDEEKRAIGHAFLRACDDINNRMKDILLLFKG